MSTTTAGESCVTIVAIDSEPGLHKDWNDNLYSTELEDKTIEELWKKTVAKANKFEWNNKILRQSNPTSPPRTDPSLTQPDGSAHNNKQLDVGRSTGSSELTNFPKLSIQVHTEDKLDQKENLVASAPANCVNFSIGKPVSSATICIGSRYERNNGSRSLGLQLADGSGFPTDPEPVGEEVWGAGSSMFNTSASSSSDVGHFRLETVTPISSQSLTNFSLSGKPVPPPKPSIKLRQRPPLQPKPSDAAIRERVEDLQTSKQRLTHEDELDKNSGFAVGQVEKVDTNIICCQGRKSIDLHQKPNLNSSSIAKKRLGEVCGTNMACTLPVDSLPSTSSLPYIRELEPTAVREKFQTCNHGSRIPVRKQRRESLTDLRKVGATSSVDPRKGGGISLADFRRDSGISLSDLRKDSGISLTDLRRDSLLSLRRDSGNSPSNLRKDSGISLSDHRKDSGISLTDLRRDSLLSLRRDSGTSPSNLRKDSGISLSDISELAEDPLSGRRHSFDRRVSGVDRRCSRIMVGGKDRRDSGICLPARPSISLLTSSSTVDSRKPGGFSDGNTNLSRPTTPSYARSFSQPVGRRPSSSQEILDLSCVKTCPGNPYSSNLELNSFCSIPDMSSGRSTPSGGWRSRIPLRITPSLSRSSTPGLSEDRRRKASMSMSTIELRKIEEAEMTVQPLKKKNKQFITRNIDLRSKNKELEEQLRNLTAQYKEAGHQRSALDNKENKNPAKDAPGKEKHHDKNHLYDIERAYLQLQREYIDLQRSYQLLQTRVQPTDKDPERLERSRSDLENSLILAEAKVSELSAQLDGSTSEMKLVEEKQDLMSLNLGLSERIRQLCKKEERLLAELQDVKDQSELLEFRVLELEECQEKGTLDKLFVEVGTDPIAELASVSSSHKDVLPGSSSSREACLPSPTDPGYHSATPSIACEEEIKEIQRDFRDEKVAETQQRLSSLVREVDGPGSKSLLLQTLALFECLVARIKELQTENKELNSKLEQTKQDPEKTAEIDEISKKNEYLEKEILCRESNIQELQQEIHSLSEELGNSRKMYTDLQTTMESSRLDMERKETEMVEERGKWKEMEREREEEREKSREVERLVLQRQESVEKDLRRQVSNLSQRLKSTLEGCKSESEMASESVLKVLNLESSIADLQQYVKDLRAENSELKDQISSTLEHHTTKSAGSLGSEFGSCKNGSVLSDSGDSTQKTPTSGIGSDLSDSEPEHCTFQSRSTSPEKTVSKFIESGIFEDDLPDRLARVEVSVQTEQPDEEALVTFDAAAVGASKRVERCDAAAETEMLSTRCMETQTCVEYGQQISNLTEEINKLSKFRDIYEKSRMTPSDSLELCADEEESLDPSVSSFTQSESNVSSLQREKDELEDKLHQRTERLDKMEEQMDWMRTETERRIEDMDKLIEEKCELEELENDTRLRCQTLEGEVSNLTGRLRSLNEELLVERKAVKHLRMENSDLQEKDREYVNEIGYLETLIHQYETKLTGLEKKDSNLTEALHSLVTGVTIWSYYHHHALCLHQGVPALLHTRSVTDTEVQTSCRRKAEDDLSVQPAAKYVKFSNSDDERFGEESVEDDSGIQHEEDSTIMETLDDNNIKEEYERMKEEHLQVMEETLQLRKELETALTEKNHMITYHQEQEERVSALEDRLVNLIKEHRDRMDQMIKEKENLQTDLQSKEEERGLLGTRLHACDQVAKELDELLQKVPIHPGEYVSELVGVVQKVELLVDEDRKHVAQIEELQKKESAYRETLAEADKLMINMENRFQEDIKTRDSEISMLKENIQQYRSRESLLQDALTGKQLQNDSLGELIRAEEAENQLKQQVLQLERVERDLTSRLLEEERRTEQLRVEVKEQEEIILQAEEIRRENNSLRTENMKIKELEFKKQEMEQSLEFLEGRVEELEQTEAELRSSVHSAEQSLLHRERKLYDLERILEEERQAHSQFKHRYEDQYDMLRVEDGSLRLVVDNLKVEISTLKAELQQRTVDSEQTETSLRNEVHKARQQLQQANEQLSELDCINQQLNSSAAQLKLQMAERCSSAEKKAEAAEESCCQMTNQLQEREETINKLKDQIEQILEKQVDREAVQQDYVLETVQEDLRDVVHHVQSCDRCTAILSVRLQETQCKLSTLSSLFSRRQSSFRDRQGESLEKELARVNLKEGDSLAKELVMFSRSSDVKEEQLDRCESEEQLVKVEDQLVHAEENLGVTDNKTHSVDDQPAKANDHLADTDDQLPKTDDQLVTAEGHASKAYENPLRGNEEQVSLTIDNEPQPVGFSRCTSEDVLDQEEEMLQLHLQQLQEKLERMESEMNIVSEESRELAGRLEDREQQIINKTVELETLHQVVESLGREHAAALHQVGQLEARVAALTERGTALQARVEEKNRILRILVPAANLSLARFRSLLREAETCTSAAEGMAENSAADVDIVVVSKLLGKRKFSSDQIREVDELKTLMGEKLPVETIPKDSVDLTLLPPENFRLTRRVGSDGLLVAWSTPEDNEIIGFQICVDEKLVQRVRSSTRTKALLHGLNLASRMEVTIHSSGTEDRVSQGVSVLYTPDLVLQEKSRKAGVNLGKPVVDLTAVRKESVEVNH